MTDPDQRDGSEAQLPSVTVTHTIKLEFPPEAVAERLPEGTDSTEFDDSVRERLHQQLTDTITSYAREHPITGGDTTVKWSDGTPDAADVLESESIGVFRIFADSGSLGRAWLFETANQAEAKDKYQAITGVEPKDIFFKRSLDDALKGVHATGAVQLSE